MPFKSRKQQDFLRINEPEIYERWMRLYGPYEADSESWQGISLAGKVDEISEMIGTRKKKAEDESEWVVSSQDIQIGDKVRSYDFCFGGKTLQLDSYVEGYVLQIAPVEWCSPNCNHYHIRTTARLMGGKVQEDYEDYYFPVADANQTVVRRLRSMNAENWGGDPDGQLAQALAKARAKSKEPRRPLKITKLPHRDQKTLKDFEADTEKEVAFQMTRKDIALVSFGAILGVVSGVIGEVLAEFWLDRYRRDPELVVSEEKQNA